MHTVMIQELWSSDKLVAWQIDDVQLQIWAVYMLEYIECSIALFKVSGCSTIYVETAKIVQRMPMCSVFQCYQL